MSYMLNIIFFYHSLHFVLYSTNIFFLWFLCVYSVVSPIIRTGRLPLVFIYSYHSYTIKICLSSYAFYKTLNYIALRCFPNLFKWVRYTLLHAHLMNVPLHSIDSSIGMNNFFRGELPNLKRIFNYIIICELCVSFFRTSIIYCL